MLLLCIVSTFQLVPYPLLSSFSYGTCVHQYHICFIHRCCTLIPCILQYAGDYLSVRHIHLASMRLYKERLARYLILKVLFHMISSHFSALFNMDLFLVFSQVFLEGRHCIKIWSFFFAHLCKFFNISPFQSKVLSPF